MTDNDVSRKRKNACDSDDSNNDDDMDNERKKACTQCNVICGKYLYTKRQWNGRLPKCRSCCFPAPVMKEKMCVCCNKVLQRESFSNSQWKRYSGCPIGIAILCKTCIEEMKNKRTCHVCQKSLEKTCFLPSHWKGPTDKKRCCKFCDAKLNSVTKSEIDTVSDKQCHQCKVSHGKKYYSYNQWKGPIEKIRYCTSCFQDALKNNERICQCCKKFLTKTSYSNCQWKGAVKRNRTCQPCVKAEKPTSRKLANIVTTKKSDDTDNENKKAVTASQSKDKKKISKDIETDPVVIKRMLTERVDMLPPHHERKNWKFQWESRSISQTDEKNMATKVIKRGYFGPLSDEEKQHLSHIIQNSSTDLSLDQALSLRSILLQQKSMFRHIHLQENAQTLFQKYNTGSTICELAHWVDCPPMNVFRSILSSMNYSKEKIKKSLRDPSKYLKEREQHEFQTAMASDIVSNLHHDTLTLANAFEDAVERFLKSQGVTFVQQTELEAEQTKRFGSPVLTPDFLLLDHVEINGRRVAWIDAKAHYGANISFNVKKIKKQTSRYVDHWGDGAIMYLYGFSENLVMDGCLMLNAQSIMSLEEILSLK